MAKPRGEAAPARADAPKTGHPQQPNPQLAWTEARPSRQEGEAVGEGPTEARPARSKPDLRPVRSRPEGDGRTSPGPREWRGAEPARPRRRVVLPMLVIALVITGGAAWYWFHGGRERFTALTGRQPESAQARPGPGGAGADNRVPVQAEAARRMDVPIYFEGLGTVQAFNTVVVRSRVDGELVEVGFQEGQMVRAGDLLARIDPRPYRAALDQARAKKAQDEATLVSNKLDLARTQKLAGSSFATQQQLDQQTATVAAQTALIQADQAAIENAETQLGYTTIRSPLDGRTGLRLVDRGNIVHASDQTGIVDITQLQPISVLFTAPEGQLTAISAAKAAGEVEVVALTSDGKTELGRGTLSLINNTVDPASGTIKLKATFANRDDKLWPGLSVNTRLLARTLRNVLTVPDTAVQRGQNELFVFTVGQDGKVAKRVVKVGDFAGGRAVIEDGLTEGDEVVTAGQSRLTPGTPVKVQLAPGTPLQGRQADADAQPQKGSEPQKAR